MDRSLLKRHSVRTRMDTSKFLCTHKSETKRYSLNLLELPRHNANTSFLSSFYRKVEVLDSEDGFASFVVAPPLENASALTGRRQHSNNLQKKHYSDNSQ